MLLCVCLALHIPFCILWTFYFIRKRIWWWLCFGVVTGTALLLERSEETRRYINEQKGHTFFFRTLCVLWAAAIVTSGFMHSPIWR